MAITSYLAVQLNIFERTQMKRCNKGIPQRVI